MKVTSVEEAIKKRHPEGTKLIVCKDKTYNFGDRNLMEWKLE